jgi:hypothetical protein
MKMLRATFLIFMLIVGLSAHGKGGTSSNGGGGQSTDHSWIVATPISEIRDGSFSEALDGFKKAYPAAPVHACPDDVQRQFPTLPNSLKRHLSIHLLKKSFWGVEGPMSFDEDFLCTDEALLEAFGHFAMLLYDVESSDPVAMHLIQKATDGRQPIPVIITNKGMSLAAKNGSLEEFTWFDPGEGRIFWAPRKTCEGMACLIKRSDGSYFKHELAHLLSWRVLGEEYPQVKQWHHGDYSNWSNAHSLTTASDLLAGETSPNAAYIEALANAIEESFFYSHPMIKVRGDFNYLRFDPETGKSCYVFPESLIERDGEFKAALGNEAYVSSALGALREAYRPQKIRDADLLLKTPSLVQSFDIIRIKAMIDAIATHAPTNIVKFAKAFDEVSGGTMGRRWLREFFFEDYETGQNTRAEFFREGDTVCSSSGKQGFLSPQLDLERRNQQIEAQRSYFARISRERILSDITATIAYINLNLRDTISKTMTLSRASEIRADSLGKAGLCHSARSVQLENKLYRQIVAASGGTAHLSIVEIVDFLNSGCRGSSKSANAAELFDGIEKANGLVKRISTTQEFKGSAAEALIQGWLSLKSRQEFLLGRVRAELFLSKVIETNGTN